MAAGVFHTSRMYLPLSKGPKLSVWSATYMSGVNALCERWAPGVGAVLPINFGSRPQTANGHTATVQGPGNSPRACWSTHSQQDGQACAHPFSTRSDRRNSAYAGPSITTGQDRHVDSMAFSDDRHPAHLSSAWQSALGGVAWRRPPHPQG